MPTCKYKIAEQILFAVNGGMPDTTSPVQIEDVMEAIGQVINVLLKTEYFNNMNIEGNTTPDIFVLATYNNIPVSVFGCNRSAAVLPVMPIALPRNLGVYQVSDKEDFSNVFIPMQAGQFALLNKRPIFSKLLNQVGYEVLGNKLVFTEDITQNGIEKVYIQEIVMDINQLGEYDPLPIPADFEDTIVQELTKRFMPIPTGDNYSDNNTQLKQPISNQ